MFFLLLLSLILKSRTTASKTMQSGINPVTLRFASPSCKKAKEKRNKRLEADSQKQQVVELWHQTSLEG